MLSRLQVFKDGDEYCVTLDDFVDLQTSPAVFYHRDSWQGKILREWWNATPLIHLTLIELCDLARRLTKI